MQPQPENHLICKKSHAPPAVCSEAERRLTTGAKVLRARCPRFSVLCSASTSSPSLPVFRFRRMCRTFMAEDAEGRKGSGKAPEVVRTVMWSPPRSLSTTVERALIENKDIHVLHEPFGTPYYWSSEAGSSRESTDARSSETYETVARRVFHDPTPNGQHFVFSKNLSYYFAPHCVPKLQELLGEQYTKARHSFMIRHPAKAISSLYYKSCIDNEKTGYTHFDPAEAGFTAMQALMEYFDAHPECPPYCIIDADDLLEDPEGIMQAYCDFLGLPFDTSMLSWQPGPVPELASPWSGWTDDVQASSGIRKREKRSLTSPAALGLQGVWQSEHPLPARETATQHKRVGHEIAAQQVAQAQKLRGLVSQQVAMMGTWYQSEQAAKDLAQNRREEFFNSNAPSTSGGQTMEPRW